MRLIVDQSLAVDFIPINTQQQRASLPFKPSVQGRYITLTIIHSFRYFVIAHYHTQAWQTLIYEKESYILLLQAKLFNVSEARWASWKLKKLTCFTIHYKLKSEFQFLYLHIILGMQYYLESVLDKSRDT